MKKIILIILAIFVFSLSGCEFEREHRSDIEESSYTEEGVDIDNDSTIGNQLPITFQKTKPAFDETLPFNYSLKEYDFNEDKYLQTFNGNADVKPSCTYTGYLGKEFFAQYGYSVPNESGSSIYSKGHDSYAYISKSDEITIFDELEYDIESTFDRVYTHNTFNGEYLAIGYRRFDSGEAFLINMETNERTPLDVKGFFCFSSESTIYLAEEEPAETLHMYNFETQERIEITLDIAPGTSFYGPGIDGDVFYMEEQGEEMLLCRYSIDTEQVEKYVIANSQSDYYYQMKNELFVVFGDKYAVIQYRVNNIDTRRITFVLNLETKALTQLDSQLSLYDFVIINDEQVIFRDESTESYSRNTNIYIFDLPTLTYNTIPTSLRQLRSVERVNNEVVVKDNDGHYIIITPDKVDYVY
ncbi:MAG TPA: hypothetical protein VJX95_02405 [Oscillospiraceae bacterium]|nr:hypothetical protein [Oscillospiraceae bacterium]